MSCDQTPPPDFLSVREFARALSVSRSLVYRLVDEGKLPSVRVGAAVRIPRAALDALRAGQSARPVSEPPPPPPATPLPRRKAARVVGFQFVPR